jgi:hypothetical protein
MVISWHLPKQKVLSQNICQVTKDRGNNLGTDLDLSVKQMIFTKQGTLNFSKENLFKKLQKRPTPKQELQKYLGCLFI